MLSKAFIYLGLSDAIYKNTLFTYLREDAILSASSPCRISPQGPPAGLFIWGQVLTPGPSEPAVKDCVAFIDGQNLYHAVKTAFGYSHPNYDVQLLAKAICHQQGWVLAKVCFYTGIPPKHINPKWHDFWAKKLAVMGTREISVFKRDLRYHQEYIELPDGSTKPFLVPREKGIDIRIALDIVKLAVDEEYDVALIFSQDQDLSEVAQEIRRISRKHNRWIKIASAYPISPTTKNDRGINSTDWIKFDKALYDRCIDPIDYRNS